jgi:hypothetical protein
MAEIFNMADFLHKNSCIFSSETAVCNFLIIGYVILFALFYCKKFVARSEKPKWHLYSRWRRKCLYLSRIFFKNDIFVLFSLFFLIFWVKIKPLWTNFFLQNSKILAEKFNLIDYIFQPLKKMFSFFDILQF